MVMQEVEAKAMDCDKNKRAGNSRLSIEGLYCTAVRDQHTAFGDYKYPTGYSWRMSRSKETARIWKKQVV